LTNVLETHEPLTGAERRARAGLSSRQVNDSLKADIERKSI
jgi:hypothetical protein